MSEWVKKPFRFFPEKEDTFFSTLCRCQHCIECSQQRLSWMSRNRPIKCDLGTTNFSAKMQSSFLLRERTFSMGEMSHKCSMLHFFKFAFIFILILFVSSQ